MSSSRGSWPRREYRSTSSRRQGSTTRSARVWAPRSRARRMPAISTETVVFTDDPRAYPPIKARGEGLGAMVGEALDLAGLGGIAAAPEVPFHHGSGLVAEEEYVSRIEVRRKVRENRVTLRDYDFKRPNLDVTANSGKGLAEIADDALTAGLSMAVNAALGGRVPQPGQAISAATTAVLHAAESMVDDKGAPRLEVYDHHGEFEETDGDARHAKMQLEQSRARARVAEGESTCRRFAAGHRFRLADVDHDLAREYTITHVSHEGEVPEGKSNPEASRPLVVYKNSFECVHSSRAYRPRRPPRVLKQVVESAVVVGPPGEEIYTDEYGRIKVQFHWDREGKRNERSSCWIRVLQAWAGAGWGFQFIPRVGMEVLVSFMGGDEDRPVVVGCVYNGTHPVPHSLPARKTQSGIRTQTTPGGQGFNELAFEDQAGIEEIFVHAQKDLREVVLNDRSSDIRHDDRTVVENDQTLRVSGSRNAEVVGDETTRVHSNKRDVVEGNHHATYLRDRCTTIGGNQVCQTRGNAHHDVRGDVIRKIAGDSLTMVVGKTPRAALHHVTGTSRFTSTELTEITSEKEIVLRCGKSVIRVLPDAIELVAPEIRARAPGSGITFTENRMEIRATDGATFKAKSLKLQSTTAELALDQVASVQAPQIKLGTNPSQLTLAADAQEKVTTIELADPKGRPIPNQHYVVLTAKGSRIGGMVGSDGKDEIYLKEGEQVIFSDLGKVER